VIRDVLSQLDYSICAEISLVLFAGVFAFVSLDVWLMRPDASARQARIAIDDGARRNGDG